MIRIDLHTHSSASPDGSITASAYAKTLESKKLDFVAITDHNTIDFALELQHELGDRIIVGEEIMTQAGEIIGLYLSELVPPGLGLLETINLIKKQNGLIYVPHPLEKTRSGIRASELETVAAHVDIIESVNGRAFVENHTKKVQEFAAKHGLAVCGSSDAHGTSGWCSTYTTLSETPTRKTLVELLQSAQIIYKKPSFRALLYPKYNRIRKKLS